MIIFKVFNMNVVFKLYDYASIRNTIERKYFLDYNFKKVNFVSDKKKEYRKLIPTSVKSYRLVKGTTFDKKEEIIGYTYVED